MKKGQEYTGKVKEIRFPNRGIVHVDEEDEVCVVKNVIPGQTVRFRVNKKRSGLCEGLLLEVIERAPYEQESFCRHFHDCGGCAYQTLPYDEQLKIKEKQVHDLLEPVIKEGYKDCKAAEDAQEVDISRIFEPITKAPAQFEYRNKMDFSFGDASYGGDLELGLHKRGSFYDIVSCTDCRIVDEDYRIILKETLAYFRGKDTPYFHKRTHEGFLRYLLVRKGFRTGEILVDLVTTSQTPKDTICTEVSLLEDWKEMLLTLPLSGKITGILHTADDRVADTIADEGTKILYGRDHFNEEILGLTFKITPFSFFQTNTLSAEVLYRKVQEYARLAGLNRSEGGKSSGMTVYDLYSGTGTIGQIMSTETHKVIGIEIVEEAVAAANENAQTNGLHNCEFLSGDVFRVLDEVDTVPDMIILDPPRDGVGPKALAKIAAYGVENIIYVSCKPTSLARDLAYLMSRGYRPVKICPIDQFPGTVHVESIALLQKMSNTRSKEITLDVDMEDYHRIKNRAEVTADATELS